MLREEFAGWFRAYQYLFIGDINLSNTINISSTKIIGGTQKRENHSTLSNGFNLEENRNRVLLRENNAVKIDASA